MTIIVAAVTAGAMLTMAVALAIALGMALTYRRALRRARRIIRDERAADVQSWTLGAPPEAVNAAFDAIMRDLLIADGGES